MVEITKPYEFDGPAGTVRAARPLRGPPAAHPRALHVRPRVGATAARAAAPAATRSPRACSTTSTRATRRWPTSRARRWPSSSAGRPTRAGRSPGTRRTAATSTTTSTSRSTASVKPPVYNYRPVDFEGEMPGTSYFLRDGDRDLPHVLDLRARRRADRRLVLLARPHRARPPGGLGGARRARADLERAGAAATSRRSAVEAEAEPVERAQPQPAPALRAVGGGEAVAGELHDRPAQRLGRERHRPAPDVPQPRRLGVAAVEQVERDARAEARRRRRRGPCSRSRRPRCRRARCRRRR